MAKTTSGNSEVLRPNPLGRDPYVEVGYGVSNIFKVLQLTMIHRVTYRNNDARNFGVFLSGRLSL
ncbi:MAG: hypothetical protein HC880_12070 [Bacteroidia bacterium]|nr:hypothetical protein [Bacteroidia bacterium]